MKKLFEAIRDGDIDLVRQLVDGKPELANCVAKQPPKKDDGQSPLQVALKTGNILIMVARIEAEKFKQKDLASSVRGKVFIYCAEDCGRIKKI